MSTVEVLCAVTLKSSHGLKTSFLLLFYTLLKELLVCGVLSSTRTSRFSLPCVYLLWCFYVILIFFVYPMMMNMVRPVVSALSLPGACRYELFPSNPGPLSLLQAPANMKSVLQGGWLLTVAFGNVIVLIVAEGAGLEQVS